MSLRSRGVGRGAREAEARQHRPHGQFGARAQRRDAVHDVVATIGRHRAPRHGAHAFFMSSYSSDTSAMRRSFLAIVASSSAMRARSALAVCAALRPVVLLGCGQMPQRLLLPELKQTRRDLVLVTQIRHRDLVAQVAAQDRGLLLRSKHTAGPLDGCLRGTHDDLRCSKVWSG